MIIITWQKGQGRTRACDDSSQRFDAMRQRVLISQESLLSPPVLGFLSLALKNIRSRYETAVLSAYGSQELLKQRNNREDRDLKNGPVSGWKGEHSINIITIIAIIAVNYYY